MTDTCRAWILANFSLFRLALFLCCIGYFVVGYHWFKPSRRELRAGLMAVWVQFALGVVLDGLVVRSGAWRYRPLPFSLGGVPLDLHVDWSMIWGCFLVWLYSRERVFWRGPKFVAVYLGLWTVLTLAFDSAVAWQLLFLEEFTRWWWLADLGFLLGVQGVTLWVYHAQLYPVRDPFWAAWSARVRSILYVGSLAYFFYSYGPSVVLSLTDGWTVPPLLGLGDRRVLVAALIGPLALGTWAVWEFTGQGFGTPVPLDPPRRLVTTGPYVYVRNPQQLSGLLLAVVLLLYHPTPFMLAYVIDMALILSTLIHLFEDAELARRYGAEYAGYRSVVKNWLPRWRTA